MKRNFILFVIYIFLSSFIYSKTYNIAVIPKGSTHDFWIEVEKGVKKAAKEFKVNVVFRGPKDDGDTFAQIKLVKTFIDKKFDAIILAPNHKSDLTPIVKEAYNKGIKIIIIDSSLDGSYYNSFIATDNFSAGKLAGEELIKMIGNKKKVGILRYRVGNSSTEMREEGFIKVMKENKMDIVIDEYGGVTSGTAYREAIKILSKKSDIVGFFTPNESSTLGTAKAISELKLQNQVTLIGFDISEDIKKYLSNDSIKGTVIQEPQNMGYLGVKTAFELLQGKKVENTIFLDTSYYSK